MTDRGGNPMYDIKYTVIERQVMWKNGYVKGINYHTTTKNILQP